VLDYIAAGVGLLDGDRESSGKVYMDTHCLLRECPVVPVGSLPPYVWLFVMYGI
jgi:hypothetical protein